MKHKLITRSLTQDDLDFIVALERAVNPSPWSLIQFQESLENHTGILLLEGETPLGYAIYLQVEDQAELLNIAVIPEKQGRGLGSLLLNQCLMECRGGTQRFYLEVRASNFSAIRLYLAKGFKQVGERRNYYSIKTGLSPNGREDALVLAYDYPNIP